MEWGRNRIAGHLSEHERAHEDKKARGESIATVTDHTKLWSIGHEQQRADVESSAHQDVWLAATEAAAGAVTEQPKERIREKRDDEAGRQDQCDAQGPVVFDPRDLSGKIRSRGLA